MVINQLRTYRKSHTDSEIFINGKRFGFGLEDVGRPTGVKINAETCIPEGAYKVAVTHSPKFNRQMCILYNVDSDHSIERHGVRFTGIRVHGGNNIEHTAGCPMVAQHTDERGKIWGSLEDELTSRVQKAIEAGESVTWIISEAV